MIANYVSILEDEYWYGWLLRLSRANALSPDIVYSEFLTGQHSYDNHKRRIPLNYPLGICRSADPLINGPDIALFLKRHTIYGVMNMMRNAGKGAAAIHSILWDSNDNLSLPVRYNDVQALYFCPQCYMEDVEAGRQPYYRTWHHIPGCIVCALHGNRLIKVIHTRNNDEHLDDTTLEKRVDGLKDMSLSMEQALATSRYLYMLYQNPRNITLKELSSVIGSSFSREPSSAKVLSRMMHTMPADELARKSQTVEMSFSSDMRTAFPDTLEILSEMDIVVKVCCRVCGTLFYDAPGALLRGCGCPKCNESLEPDSIIARQLALVGDGKYFLAEPFHGYHYTTKVLHTACGKVSSIRLLDRIWIGAECQCVYRTSVDDIQREIDPAGTRYTVISYAGGRKDKQRVRILHSKCNRAFDVQLDKFKKSPYCRCCTPRKWNTEVFQEQLDLRKNGFEVVSEYVAQNTPVRAKHLVCGTITEWLPEQWLHGCGCRLCQPIYTYEDVCAAIEQYANEPNITTLPERGGVRIMFDGTKSVWKSYRVAMQELFRPGWSELFPNKKDIPHEKISDRAELYMTIKAAVQQCRYWKLAEHPDNISYVRTKQIVRILLKQGYIEKIEPGVYKTREAK